MYTVYKGCPICKNRLGYFSIKSLINVELDIIDFHLIFSSCSIKCIYEMYFSILLKTNAYL